MPRLSDTMEEGVVATWLKKVGDKVQEGEILAEIETDKATMEFESFYDGILSHIAVNEGETVKVDELIAIISENEIDVPKALESYGNESSIIPTFFAVTTLTNSFTFGIVPVPASASSTTFFAFAKPCS